jgi:hypothetical protein
VEDKIDQIQRSNCIWGYDLMPICDERGEYTASRVEHALPALKP